MKTYAALLIIAAAATHLVHRELLALSDTSERDLRDTLPSEESLRLLSAGYKSLAADYYWLRAISEFGDNAYARANYPNLAALTTRVLALDPYYLTAYEFAGTALTVKELDPHIAIGMLRKGLIFRKEAWRLPFLLGFNLYYFDHAYAEASDYLARAALLPGSPEFVGPLATRLAAEAGQPELGLQLVDSLLESTQDEKMRAVYEERRRLLQLEVQIRYLQSAVDRYVAEHGERPSDLAELVNEGVLPFVPQDPLGGRYAVNAEGRVTTTSEAQRLRLPAGAQGASP